MTRALPVPPIAPPKLRQVDADPLRAHTERELFDLVFRRMHKLSAGSPDFEDLVQLAAEQVFRSLPSFDGRSELETWIYGVCYRVLMSQRRWYWRFRQRFQFDASVVESNTEGSEPSPHDLLQQRQDLALLKRGLSRMSDKYRAVIVLHYFEGLTTEDIANIVQSNELTVRSRLRDGRKQLLKLLGKDGRKLLVEGTG